MAIVPFAHSLAVQTSPTRRVEERLQNLHERTALFPRTDDLLVTRPMAGLIFGGSVPGAMCLLFQNRSISGGMNIATRSYINQLLSCAFVLGAVNGILIGLCRSEALNLLHRPETRSYNSISGQDRNWRLSISGTAFSSAVSGANINALCFMAAWACYSSKTDDVSYTLTPELAAVVGWVLAGAADVALSQYIGTRPQNRTTRVHAPIPLQTFLAEP